jgi:hypothetical protein
MKFSLGKNRLLLLLILTDLAFLILHLLYTYTDLLPGNNFSLALDGGYAEFFQYIKEFWIVILFLLLGVRQRQLAYLIFAGIFLYFLIDDSFTLHEIYGAFLADSLAFQPLFGLRAIDFGELIVSAVFGALLFAALGISYYLSDPGTRKISRTVIAMVLVLALFGVLIDMVDIMLRQLGGSEITGTIEEFGEMLVMSVITWYVFGLDLNHPVTEQ